ncbi:MAG: flagellin [Anaerolineaceae bacterium]|nr:flagellin [Anaerolineaceae bacterium]
MSSNDITRVAGNIGAMNALNALNNINKQLSIHQTRLSTGKAINSAADDPAGLTIATKMNAHSQGLTTALSNIGDAQNLLSVAEAGMSSLNDILTDMRDKAESAASDTMGTEERAAIVTQLQADAAQIDDNATQTQWNGSNLIDGSYATTALSFQTGDASTDTTSLSGLNNMAASGKNANGADSLEIADKRGAILDATDAASTALFSGASTAGTGTPSLATGTYTVQVVEGHSAGKIGDKSTVNLLDAGGNTVATSGAGAVDLSAAGSVDFADGLKVNLNAIDQVNGSGTTTTGSVNYIAKGDYALYSKGDGSAAAPAGSNLLTGSSTAADFRDFMNTISTKMTAVSTQLSQIGAMEDRLSYKSDQVTSAQTNVQGAYNRIMNADMASEQVAASKYQILQQTATAMLSQANSAPQFLLKLFQ